MGKGESSTKGSIVLATVRGDVHDIGKNLVDIILTNNGYTVHNIGIKQPIDAILKALADTQADAVGMSGLLVKSVNVMEENLNIMKDKGIDTPTLLGGAALARDYGEGHLRRTYAGENLFYCQDAFEGLRAMDLICSGNKAQLEEEINQRESDRTEKRAKIQDLKDRAAERREGEPLAARSKTSVDNPLPEAPYLGVHHSEDIDIDHVYGFVNKNALFKFQWQFTRGEKSTAEYEQQLKDEAEPVFARLKEELREVLQPKVVWGYFPCYAEGDDLVILDPETKAPRERLDFPRQPLKPRLCISDYFRSKAALQKDADGHLQYDVVAFQCVTMGQPVSELAAKLYAANAYKEYLFVHGMGVECAEALAELWHKRVRQELAINQKDGVKTQQLFTGKYQGCRYSWGYPSCPDMSHHEAIWRLLQPDARIGCALTESHQIDPEQSTCAIICHHPEAKYFVLQGEDATLRP